MMMMLVHSPLRASRLDRRSAARCDAIAIWQGTGSLRGASATRPRLFAGVDRETLVVATGVQLCARLDARLGRDGTVCCAVAMVGGRSSPTVAVHTPGKRWARDSDTTVQYCMLPAGDGGRRRLMAAVHTRD